MKKLDDELENIPKELCLNCGKCCKNLGCNFPASPWEKLPDGCGYEGWIFKIREEIKQKVRKKKEFLLELEIFLKTASTQQKAGLDLEKQEIIDFVKKYAKFGSLDW